MQNQTQIKNLSMVDASVHHAKQGCDPPAVQQTIRADPTNQHNQSITTCKELHKSYRNTLATSLNQPTNHSNQNQTKCNNTHQHPKTQTSRMKNHKCLQNKSKNP
jgi:hypothetical protein